RTRSGVLLNAQYHVLTQFSPFRLPNSLHSNDSVARAVRKQKSLALTFDVSFLRKTVDSRCDEFLHLIRKSERLDDRCFKLRALDSRLDTSEERHDRRFEQRLPESFNFLAKKHEGEGGILANSSDIWDSGALARRGRWHANTEVSQHISGLSLVEERARDSLTVYANRTDSDFAKQTVAFSLEVAFGDS